MISFADLRYPLRPIHTNNISLAKDYNTLGFQKPQKRFHVTIALKSRRKRTTGCTTQTAYFQKYPVTRACRTNMQFCNPFTFEGTASLYKMYSAPKKENIVLFPLQRG